MLLIFVANRFNSAYYLLLDAGPGSAVRESNCTKVCFGVVEKRQIAGLQKFTLRVASRRWN